MSLKMDKSDLNGVVVEVDIKNIYEARELINAVNEKAYTFFESAINDEAKEYLERMDVMAFKLKELPDPKVAKKHVGEDGFIITGGDLQIDYYIPAVLKYDFNTEVNLDKFFDDCSIE